MYTRILKLYCIHTKAMHLFFFGEGGGGWVLHLPMLVANLSGWFVEIGLL